MSKFAFNFKTLQYHGQVQEYEGYHDYDFVDDDPCQVFCVTYVEESNTWYGMHSKSETAESDFDDGHRMTMDEVDWCRNLIPVPELPPVMIETEYTRLLRENGMLKEACNWYDLEDDMKEAILSGEY